jgi:hypothetical protein
MSVNRFWGTAITYAGYFMLFFSMMAIMFTKDARFADLKIRSCETKKIKVAYDLCISCEYEFSSTQP